LRIIMRHQPLLNPPHAASFYQPLLRWFSRHKRNLPWRIEPRDPYRVWLAEVMLQQTQVGTVISYYERWLQHFPTLQSLASAPLDDVLKQWEGLGYYSRSRNMHRSAQMVLRDYGGQIPSDVVSLLKLPGVGRYTAGAISSLAFQQDAPILDGNVTRVLARVLGISTDIRDPVTLSRLWHLSEQLLPRGRAGRFNEALMDLGAIVCTPHAPSCTTCPLHIQCIAYTKGDPEAYPVKIAKKPIPTRVFLTAVISDAQGHLLLAQRPPRGLLGGLWEFPGGEDLSLLQEPTLPATLLEQMIRSACGLRITVRQSDFFGLVKHTFTHFHMVRHVALVRLTHTTPNVQPSSKYTNLRWVARDQIAGLALTRSDQKTLALVDDAPERIRQLSLIES
jgi:A/G-specific adenine glycosylase